MTKILKLLGFVSLLVGIPLLTMFVSGSPIKPYLEFPPTTEYTEPHTFSWLVFAILSVTMAGILYPFILRFMTVSTSNVNRLPSTNFPLWGWGGLGLILISWALAWSRFSVFQFFQDHTFTPLWCGYILVINALTFKRTGQCLLTEKPYLYFGLFPISAAFWWLFEFLNRFVHNWYYLGGQDYKATTYFFAATLPFSTVLPAVIGTNNYLNSFPCLVRPYQNWWKVPIPHRKWFGGANLLAACTGLVGIGLWPTLFFALLWLSPLLILVGLQRIFGEKSLLEDLREGHWHTVAMPALAGVICGFFWEMWNFYSLAHWRYLIPYVQGFHIFEMPLLGYFGYLPFGITCVVLVQFLFGETFSPHPSNYITNGVKLWRRHGPTSQFRS